MNERRIEDPGHNIEAEASHVSFSEYLDKNWAVKKKADADRLAEEIAQLRAKSEPSDDDLEALTEKIGKLEKIYGPDRLRDKEINDGVYSNRFKTRVIAFSEDILADRTDPGRIALGLAGIDTEETWQLRDDLAKKKANIGNLALSVIGIESEKAWKIRNEAYVNAPTTKSCDEIITFARSLSGLDSEHAWMFREKLLEEKDPSVLESLHGLDSERAWEVREKMQNSIAWSSKAISMGLIGLESDKAWEGRQTISRHQTNGNLADSLFGLDSERAWRERERLLTINAELIDKAIAKGLAGLDSERAWEMRMRLYNKGKLDHEIAVSLAGIDSDRAWEMREKMLSKGMGRRMVARSMSDWRLVVVRRAAINNLKKQ